MVRVSNVGGDLRDNHRWTTAFRIASVLLNVSLQAHHRQRTNGPRQRPLGREGVPRRARASRQTYPSQVGMV